jgi:hypothetical protein
VGMRQLLASVAFSISAEGTAGAADLQEPITLQSQNGISIVSLSQKRGKFPRCPPLHSHRVVYDVCLNPHSTGIAPFLEARIVYKEPRAGVSGIRLTLLDDILAGPRGSQISVTGVAIQCYSAALPGASSGRAFLTGSPLLN